MIFLAFVFPVAVYCLVLAALNRSRHPIMVSGPWDFAGVLFAASGLLLLGGPAILTGIYEHWRLSWLLGQTHFLQGLGESWHFWITLWLLYFLVILVGAFFLILRRRSRTSIYNIEPAVLDEVLGQVLDRLGLESVRSETGRISIRPREDRLSGRSPAFADPPHAFAGSRPLFGHRDAGPSPQGVLAPQPTSMPLDPWVGLDQEPFPALRHVTLHWLQDNGCVRREVEKELAKALADVHTGHNPVGGWFLSLGIALFFLTFFGLFALVVLRNLMNPR